MTVSIKKRLNAFVAVVLEEAARNREFDARLKEVLGVDPTSEGSAVVRRRGGRRPAAVLDPIDLARHGEGYLRSNLEQLTLDQLHDIVAEFGMDAAKLVMKWKDRGRVIDRIVELSLSRATKGDAFRRD
jgi:hypothetical protein